MKIWVKKHCPIENELWLQQEKRKYYRVYIVQENIPEKNKKSENKKQRKVSRNSKKYTYKETHKKQSKRKEIKKM